MVTRRLRAIGCFRSALEVYTREASPQDWAAIQNLLGLALRDQALATEGADRAQLFGEAVAAFHFALDVQPREACPQDWAMTQNNLGVALRAQASASGGTERARLLGVAIVALKNAVEVFTLEFDPEQHTAIVAEIKRLEAELAKLQAPKSP